MSRNPARLELTAFYRIQLGVTVTVRRIPNLEIGTPELKRSSCDNGPRTKLTT